MTIIARLFGLVLTGLRWITYPLLSFFGLLIPWFKSLVLFLIAAKFIFRIFYIGAVLGSSLYLDYWLPSVLDSLFTMLNNSEFANGVTIPIASAGFYLIERLRIVECISIALNFWTFGLAYGIYAIVTGVKK